MVGWEELYHAYGPAGDVRAQLVAVIAGDDQARQEAWWSLWGNIHHQGTIYEATVPAVPILFGIARWRVHPDRAQALLMLREIGAAPGVCVWRHGADGELVADDTAQQRLYPELRRELLDGAATVLAEWRSEPQEVQRALLWLISIDASLCLSHAELVAELRPAEHRRAWELELAEAVESEEDADAVAALEEWVHHG